MNYIQLLAGETGADKHDMLIALLADKGFEGFEETDNRLKAFIPETLFSKEKTDEIFNMLQLSYDLTVVKQQNWNEAWESSFEPIIVNDFVSIRAAFHKPVSHVTHEIIITPKMSFGTGHHATTYMMIQQMEELDFAGKTVLDFGTGTAVLAILAEKMGAAAVDAIDCDDWSIENSIENMAANKCSNITLIKDEIIRTGKTYDIILANINLNVIMANLAAIKSAGKKESFTIISGFTPADEAVMKQHLSATGFSPVNTLQKGDWINMAVK